MRVSEFWERLEDAQGGPFARHWARTQVLAGLDHRTVEEALEAGVPPKAVWRVVGEALDLPARER
jgi:hypothetical protein